MKYSESEINYLKENYSSESKKIILNNLNGHSWYSIKDKAIKLGFSRPNIRTDQLKKLLENNLINAYWWGLILSDGHLTNRGELIIRLQNLDLNYLKVLSDYIGCKLNYIESKNMVSLSAMDKINGIKLKNKLGITEKKTYNPPLNFDFLKTKEEMLSFLIGFIDGDGNITFNEKGVFKSIRIIIHGSWFNVMSDFINRLGLATNIHFTIKKNKRGNTFLYIGKKDNYMFLKKHINDNNINVLARKWK